MVSALCACAVHLAQALLVLIILLPPIFGLIANRYEVRRQACAALFHACRCQTRRSMMQAIAQV
jgi:hypothetical protein